MTRREILCPEAAGELQESFRWYEGQRPGLGDEFLARIEDSLKLIPANARGISAETQNCSASCCSTVSLYDLL